MAGMRPTEPVLSIDGLVVDFETPDGVVHAVDHVGYAVWPGETLAVVGESGSGKSVTAQSILGLVPQPPGRISGGRVTFEGRDLLSMTRREMRDIRGKSIAMIFQDPMTSLNPVLTVGKQISEAMTTHGLTSPAEAKERTISLLKEVGFPNARERFSQYPHQFSGGMRQRALIAMAIANRPKVLICDEPTTALDVTIQAQVFETLKRAQADTKAAMILITHDLGLVAELADRVVVMYAGRVVETASVIDIFRAPKHPYTAGLLASLPHLEKREGPLVPIPGTPPSLIKLPTGCPFHPRCLLGRGRTLCRTDRPELEPSGIDRRSACHFAGEVSKFPANANEHA